MSKKKVIIAAVAIVGIGAAVGAVAQGHRNWQRGHGGSDHGGMGMGMGPGFGMGDGQGHGMGGMRRGWFGGREVTKDAHDGHVRERFARLDKNSDGVVDAAEVEASVTERRQGMMQRMRDRFGGQGAAGPGGPGAQGAAGPGMRMLRGFDTNKDGKVTRAEFIDRAKARFAEMDLDGDGRITDGDLPPMMRGRNALADSGRGGRGMLRQFGDVEVKDGAITLAAVEAAAGRAFDRLDRNKDGTLDQADADAMRKETVDYQVKRFMHHFGAKDGKVTREQFFAKANQRFAEMDFNNDGRITRDEMGPMGGRGMRGHMMRGHGRDHGGAFDGPMGGGPMGGPQGGPPPKQ